MRPRDVDVVLKDDPQIAVCTSDGATGRFTRKAEVPMPGVLHPL